MPIAFLDKVHAIFSALKHWLQLVKKAKAKASFIEH
jgi:hypothetical protein